MTKTNTLITIFKLLKKNIEEFKKLSKAKQTRLLNTTNLNTFQKELIRKYGAFFSLGENNRLVVNGILQIEDFQKNLDICHLFSVRRDYAANVMPELAKEQNNQVFANVTLSKRLKRKV